jgi:hypothetical protein
MYEAVRTDCVYMEMVHEVLAGGVYCN